MNDAKQKPAPRFTTDELLAMTLTAIILKFRALSKKHQQEITKDLLHRCAPEEKRLIIAHTIERAANQHTHRRPHGMNIHNATEALKEPDHRKLAEHVKTRVLMHATNMAAPSPFQTLLSRIASALRTGGYEGARIDSYILGKFLEAQTQPEPRAIMQSITLDIENWILIHAPYAPLKPAFTPSGAPPPEYASTITQPKTWAKTTRKA